MVSPYINRFLSADTVVPNPSDPQAFNRYSYVLGNPLRYIDPTGHGSVCGFSYSDPECYAPDPWAPPGGGGGGGGGIIGGGGGGRTGGGGGGAGDGFNVSNPPSIVPLDDGLVMGDSIPASSPTPAPNLGGGQTSPMPDSNSGETILDNNSQNGWPDYYVGSLYIPFFAKFPLFGLNLSLTVDKYWNWYFSPGIAVGLGPGANIGGGWFLGPNNNTEAFAENFLQGNSFNVSGGLVIGVGVNNVYPSYIQTNNEGSGIENIAIEGLVTTPGLSGVFSYQWLIYDQGDATPWIFQGD